MSEGIFEGLDVPDRFEEVDDDEEPVRPTDVASAFVTDTDWTAETILSQLRRGTIKLDPRFQRRDAWDRRRKSRFIESLILGLPIPQIVLAEDRRRKGAFIVLDGKQRLLTLWQFAAGSSFGDASDAAPEPLHLLGLEVRSDLDSQTLSSLEQDPSAQETLSAFLNQTVRTVVVRNWPDDNFLNLVFLRLNTGSVSLSPQELRQALRPGPFTDFIDDYSSESQGVQRALRIDRPDFRMRDVEILLRFFAFSTRLLEYRGSMKEFLDETLDYCNGLWSSDRAYLDATAASFELAVTTTFDTFGGDAFFRFNSRTDRYERRFNRAVFDVMAYFFRDPDIAHQAVSQAADVELAFRELCTADTEFVEAIQSTTKTVAATQKRLDAWGATLGSVLRRRIEAPRLTATPRNEG